MAISQGDIDDFWKEHDNSWSKTVQQFAGDKCPRCGQVGIGRYAWWCAICSWGWKNYLVRPPTLAELGRTNTTFKVGDRVEILAHNRFSSSGTREFMDEGSVGRIGFVCEVNTDPNDDSPYVIWGNVNQCGGYYGHYGGDELALIPDIADCVNEKAAIKVTKEQKTMDKFYRVKKDNHQVMAGAVIGNGGGTTYSPISPLWNVIEDVTPMIDRAYVEAKENREYFERVYMVQSGGKTVYLPKKEAQAEFEATVTPKTKKQ